MFCPSEKEEIKEKLAKFLWVDNCGKHYTEDWAECFNELMEEVGITSENTPEPAPELVFISNDNGIQKIKSVVGFTGFNQEAINIAVLDSGRGHDHLEIYHGSRRLCYLHIDGNMIDVYTRGSGFKVNVRD